MAKQVRLLRVFVSSPGDVVTEREILDEVVERVNSTDGDVHSLRLELFRWEDNIVPQVTDGPGGPQDVVFSQMPEYDIYLGIMAARFGTPTGGFGSGTEAEFRAALQKTQHANGQGPWIMFFFKENVPAPRLDELEQYQKVLEFKEELKRWGIIGTYTALRGSDDGFFDKVEHYLRLLVQRLSRSTGTQTKPKPLVHTRNDEETENRQFRKEQPPTKVDKRAALVARALPEVFDVINPCYLLDENFFFLDWNIAFDELIAKPMRLARDDHAGSILSASSPIVER